VALNHVVTAAVLSPYVVRHGDLWPAGWQWLFVAGLGMFQMGLPYLLFARGLRSVPSHEASAITLLEPVFVPLWVFLAWHNAANYTPPRWWTLVGGALILTGLSIRYASQLRVGSAVDGRKEGN
jgi:drug/metabolite transporter (DMT)-like permease